MQSTSLLQGSPRCATPTPTTNLLSRSTIPDAPPTQPRVLVCDDAPTLRAHLAAVLGKRYALLLTASAEEALARAPAFAPDLVITDHILPGMTGRALVARLRAIPAFEDVPIILLTAVSDADARADGIEAGADEYLVKPIRERELLARVASLLRLRRTLLALSRRSRELEDANQALQEAQERIVRTERLVALGSLAASLAHDINGPLSIVTSGASAIRWIIQEAEKGEVSADAGRVARLLRELDSVGTEVEAASRRLQEIGRDLRLFGSGQPGEPARIRVEDSVRSAIALARSRSEAPPPIALEVKEAPEIDAPPQLVTLVLLSILDRAVLAAGTGGHVQVSVAPAEGGVEVTVRDDGPPIPVHLLPRVFEPFVRLHATHETAGLGLAVAAGIVAGLGGHIDVDGQATTGACFRVLLPAAPPAPQG